MVKTMTIDLKYHKGVTVFAATDEAGNKRLVPIGGATLEQWRADPALLPPWILGSDLENPDLWGEYYKFLSKGE